MALINSKKSQNCVICKFQPNAILSSAFVPLTTAAEVLQKQTLQQTFSGKKLSSVCKNGKFVLSEHQ